MTRTSTPGLIAGRYELRDLVADKAGSALWRAEDTVLDRPVGVRLLPRADSRAADLKSAAVAAATLMDRHVVRVLDVLEHDDKVVVVTEWVAGTPYDELIRSSGHPDGDDDAHFDCVGTVRAVARCVAAAHAADITHGRLRPSAVLVTDTGEVRVRGFGVDAVLWGVSPEEASDDARAADLHGVGALLYAGLTRRWPDGPVDDLEAAPRNASGRVPWPSRVTADVTPALDEVCARTLLTTSPVRGKTRYESAAALVDALVTTPTTALHAPPTRTEPRSPYALRALRAGVAALCAVLLIVVGVRWAISDGGRPLSTNTTAPLITSQTASSAGTTPNATPTRLQLVAAKDFDPYGRDKKENSQLVAGAIDNKPTDGWTTSRYVESNIGRKPGVGLIIDLGTPRPMSLVTLRLRGSGSDFELRTADAPGANEKAYQLQATVKGAGESVTVRFPTPVTARYLLIWFTGLPYVNGFYQAGINDVVVKG